jgi:hypothetical protein
MRSAAIHPFINRRHGLHGTSMPLIDILRLHDPTDSEKSAIRAFGGIKLNKSFDKLVRTLASRTNLSYHELARNVYAVNPNSLQNWRGFNAHYPNGHPIPLGAIDRTLDLLQLKRTETHRGMLRDIKYLQCGRVARRVKAAKELGSDLAKLCGAHAADGSMTSQKGRRATTVQWMLGDQERANIIAVRRWVQKLFGFELDVRRKRKMYYVRASMQVLPKYLSRIFDFPVGEKSHSVSEPIIFGKSDSRLLSMMTEDDAWKRKFEFACEVVNFDGHSTVSGRTVSVGLGSASPKLRRDLLETFCHFGVKFHNYDAHDKMLTTSLVDARKLYSLGLFRGAKRRKFAIILGRWRISKAEKHPGRGAKRA